MKYQYILNVEKVKELSKLHNVSIREVARSQNIPIKRMENLIYRNNQKAKVYATYSECKRIADYFKTIVEAIATESNVDKFYHKTFDLPKLPDKEIDVRNHYENGMLAYRTENGHSVIYTQGYMLPSDIHKRVAECRKWALEKGIE